MMNKREGTAESRTHAERLYEEFGARRTQTMHAFHIHYRNTQGTLMRILTAVSRRGLCIQYLQASAHGTGHRADLLLEVNEKQIGQLDQEMATLLSHHQDAVKRLAEVPGLGVDSAQQIIASALPQRPFPPRNVSPRGSVLARATTRAQA